MSAAVDTTTAEEKPFEVATVLMAAISAVACAAPAAGSVLRVVSASLTLSQLAPHATVYRMFRVVDPAWRRRLPAPTSSTSTGEPWEKV